MSSHTVENGFEMLTVTDATAAAGHDALKPAHANFGFIAHETATVAEVTDRLATATADSAEAVSTDGSRRVPGYLTAQDDFYAVRTADGPFADSDGLVRRNSLDAGDHTGVSLVRNCECLCPLRPTLYYVTSLWAGSRHRHDRDVVRARRDATVLQRRTDNRSPVRLGL